MKKLKSVIVVEYESHVVESPEPRDHMIDAVEGVRRAIHFMNHSTGKVIGWHFTKLPSERENDNGESNKKEKPA